MPLHYEELPFVLVESLGDENGRTLYYRGMTEIGPSFTCDRDKAVVFSRVADARKVEALFPPMCLTEPELACLCSKSIPGLCDSCQFEYDRLEREGL